MTQDLLQHLPKGMEEEVTTSGWMAMSSASVLQMSLCPLYTGRVGLSLYYLY